MTLPVGISRALPKDDAWPCRKCARPALYRGSAIARIGYCAEHPNDPPMPLCMGTDDRELWAERLRAAGRYAVRTATMNGKEADFDPDALIQNLIIGMLGYWTPDGHL